LQCSTEHPALLGVRIDRDLNFASRELKARADHRILMLDLCRIDESMDDDVCQDVSDLPRDISESTLPVSLHDHESPFGFDAALHQHGSPTRNPLNTGPEVVHEAGAAESA
jgi:hypothetical protein